jgi:hypothetical protein
MDGVRALDGKGRLGAGPQLVVALGTRAIIRRFPKTLRQPCGSEFHQDRSFLRKKLMPV